jgi:glucose/arabinose dehydrogenase
MLGGTLLLAGLFGSGPARAASLQPIGNFDEPIYVTSTPGNPERLLVVERAGLVLEVEGSRTAVFADLTAAVGCLPGECEGERGLLSIALAPDFESSGSLYADYASEADGAIHVVELHFFSPGVTTSRQLLKIPHEDASNHYGGQLQIGPEGDLFISTGDGGGSKDQFHNAQDLESLLGKILRLDPDPSEGLPYTVPAGNPFPGATAPYNTIWSYGLRNPFRFSFDRATGAMLIGDVGQDSWEEVDYAPPPARGAGTDYGWNCREGFEPGPATDPGCSSAVLTDPVFAYPDSETTCSAIIGGYVARDASLGGLYGRYLHGDLCSGQLRSFALPPADPAASDRSEGLKVTNLNSFGEDSCGRLYVVSGDGLVARLLGTSAAVCTPPPPPLAYSFAGIRAKTKRVKKNRRALISVWVAPCAGRQGEAISLYRGRNRIGTRHLDRVCSARFRPRLSRRSSYRATIKADSKYLAASSRKLTIKPRRRLR